MFYFDLEYFAFAKLNFISYSTSLFLSNNLHISMPAANGMWNKLFWFLSHFLSEFYAEILSDFYSEILSMFTI